MSKMDSYINSKFGDLSMFSARHLANNEDVVRNCKILVEASRIGDLEIVDELLNEGVSINATDYNKSLFYASHNYVTPLQAACEANQLSCVKYLISRGADVNCKDRFDLTAVHVAAENGYPEVLQALLEAGADCSGPTRFSKKINYAMVPHFAGTTPLHLAALFNNVECVILLIQFGADYNAVDERGRTSLYVAAQLGYSDCVLAHLRYAVGRDILSLPSNETGDTPLHFAVRKGMVECVQELLRVGSDPNHLNFSGISPLHCAVHPALSGMDNTVKQVLKLLVLKGHNINVNQKNGAGFTALHYCGFDSGINFVRRPGWAKFLIKYGADPMIKNQRGCTLIESELRMRHKDYSVLSVIVQSLKHSPSIKTLLADRPLAPFRNQPLYAFFHMADYEDEQWHRSAARETLFREKVATYVNMSTEPRTLQHLCRCSIRNSLGSRRLRHVKDLPLPLRVKKYLLLMTSTV